MLSDEKIISLIKTNYNIVVKEIDKVNDGCINI